MNPEASSTATKVCPTCGTRLNENATRCLVCGRNFPAADVKKAVKAGKTVQGPRMPEITISLPVALGLIILVLAVGAGIVFAATRGTAAAVVEATVTTSPTVSPTPSFTATMTMTNPPADTPTPLPPVEYVVQSGDFCSSIAIFYDVSVQSIVSNNPQLGTDCTLSIGQTLLIPQPTPTSTPQPTITLSGVDATDAACEKFDYTVGESDTLGGIARNYNVSMESIREYNGMTNDIVYQGQILKIPLCQRLPPAGTTATPTIPPPYAAANLLQPADGQSFANAETISLQWSSVGTLRENESYAVTVEDITEGTGRKLTEYVTDTKFIVPAGFRPNTNDPHIIRWTVATVRQSGTAEDGNPIWVSAGTVSPARVFSWWGSAGAAATPTP